MQGESRDIPITEIVEPHLVLRLVNRESVEYLELRDSIAAKGFINSICVRPSVRVNGKYEVVDGLYRFNCALDLRLASVPCIVKYNLTDQDVLALQVQANAIRPETTATEFARQLQKIMSHEPDMTMARLANIVHKSPKWVRDTLNLLDLSGEMQKSVDRGEMPLENAYRLAKIPRTYRKDFLDSARTLTAKEFRVVAANFIKRFTEAVRQGKLEALYTADFEPHPFLRSLRDVQDEYVNRRAGALTVAAANCRTPLDGWYLALEWALHLDPNSIEQQKQAALHREHRSFQRPEEDTDEVDP